ncbi:hypothetical protein F511_31605 [Dorcoceras hygrometricum]|uniref:Uncharacterized protein n=1 Tax=Dorcoceras hygrometricum TaxID=472368 RepID=A0A2Z7B4A7_9LAMI|nr:hypothetical protein F511_31605 [Dorcoceras hygrometricum]
MFSNKLFNSCSLSCCLFFVTTLRATAVSFLRLVVAPLQFTSHPVFLFIAMTGCPDVDLEVLATAGCPVVGHEMLATGFPNDCCEEQKPDVDVKRDLESAMMTSAVMSSQSAVVKRSARAGSVLMKSAVTSAISREIQCNQQLVLEVSDSKTMSFGLIDTTAFCLRAKIQHMLFALITSSRKIPVAKYTSRNMMHPVTGYSVMHIQSQEIQTQEKQT